MKIFTKDYKINFVDDNNVFVGYDIEQSCCEMADWFIFDRELDDIEVEAKKYDIKQYMFDTNYFKCIDNPSFTEYGRMVRFKLISNSKPNLFLHLYNVHNGYYGHGFEANIGGIQWQQGVL
jgi:hypothetical protein